MDLTVYYQNTRGLRSKTQEFYTSSVGTCVDIICLTETWLNDGVQDGELFDLDIFQVFRQDRDTISSGKRDGGGVLIAVNKKFSTQECKSWLSPGICEDLWISVSVRPNINLNVCCVYVPPYASEDNFVAHLNNVTKIVDQHPNDYFLIVGDYNVPNLTWNFDTAKHCYIANVISDRLGESLVDAYNFLLFNQFNGITNANGKLLDLVFSSISNVNVIACDLPFVPEDPHHKSLIITVNFSDLLNMKAKLSYRKYKFHVADYDIINRELSSINWDDLFHGLNTNESVSLFYVKLRQIIEDYIPVK